MKIKDYLFTIAICLFLTQISYAEQNKDVTLEEVVVTATRDNEVIYKVPANVNVITFEDIEKSGESTIPELLEKYANIHFRSYSGNSSQAQIDLRGFGGDNPFGKTLILLNGKRLNRPDMASINWLQIPIEQIEKIEVVRGGASVLYGNFAIAGVINIITKKGSKNLKIDSSISIGSNNKHVERAGLTGSEGNLSYAANAESYNTDGERDRSAFSSKGCGLSFSYDFPEITTALNLSYNKTINELPGSLTKKEMIENRKQFQHGHSQDDVVDESVNIDAAIRKITEQYGDLELKIVYNYNNIISNMASSWYPNRFNTYNIETFGILPKYILEAAPFGFANKLITGLDYYNKTLLQDKYKNRERIDKTHKAEIGEDSLGWYVKNELSLKEDLLLALGFRSEKAKIKGEEQNLTGEVFDNKTSHNVNVFDVSVTKLFGGHSKVFGKFSTLYRYPFIDEQVYYNGSNGDKFIKDLNPEKGENYEIGCAYSPYDKLNTNLSLFDIEMKDTIAYVGMFPNGSNKNIGETRHRGIEFSISYKIQNKVSLYLNYNYNKATSENGENSGKELPMVPNHKLSAEIEIPLANIIYLSTEVQYTGSAYLLNDFDNSTEKLDSYKIYSVYLRYKPETSNLKAAKLSAFIGIKNIFNTDYSSAGFDMKEYGMANKFYPSPWCEFTSGISFNF